MFMSQEAEFEEVKPGKPKVGSKTDEKLQRLSRIRMSDGIIDGKDLSKQEVEALGEEEKKVRKEDEGEWGKKLSRDEADQLIEEYRWHIPSDSWRESV